MMTAETASAEKDSEPARPGPTAASPEVSHDGGYAGTVAAGWLGHELLSHPANSGVRALAMRRTQQTHGNRFAQRMLSTPGGGAPSGWLVQRRSSKTGGGDRDGALAVAEAPDPGAAGPLLPGGAGEPLDSPARRFMEPRFGRDLGEVRIHADESAAAAATALEARAFTAGRDVYFARGEYAPQTADGRRLLAHELVHTVQQGPVARMPAIGVSSPEDPLEREAEHVSAAIVDGAPVPDITPGDPVLARDVAPQPFRGSSGSADSPAEREADEIAAAATAGQPGLMATCSCASASADEKCPACGGQQPVIRRAAEPGKSVGVAPPAVDQALAAPGRSLEPAVQRDMGQHFGYDFSSVRVHTDTTAAESARAVSARAYTVGNDIVFGRGHFAPETSAGKRLLAHELTHVVQQLGRERNSPSINTLQRDSTDDLADEIAHDLDNYVKENASPYRYILDVFHHLDSDIEDNVAAAFVELQSDTRLEKFAADKEGLEVLDVLREAMITGHVTLFETQQAERLLIAKRNLISNDEYAEEAERIAKLRHSAAPAYSEDQRVSQTAKDLNAYVAKGLYQHVIDVFDDLPSSIEDNVAAEFVESQPDANLVRFATSDKGRDMLDVLYKAMITGNVSSFEALQSERILIAKAKGMALEKKERPDAKEMSLEEYVAHAQRIASLRDRAEDDTLEELVDLVAAEMAQVLNQDVAKGLYGEIIAKIQDLSHEIEDNVASHFIELQSPARLEMIAADKVGRAMLRVCYEAIITGAVTDFEKLQAERILEVQARRTHEKSPEEYVQQLKEERQWVLPLRMQSFFRSSYAIFKATLEPSGKVKVLYDDEIHFWDADMFKEDRKPLDYRKWSTGVLLEPDELVWLKLYDQNKSLVPVPAIALIDYANQAMRHSVSVGVTAFQTGFFLGLGGLGAFSGARVSSVAAEVEAGEATVTALNMERAVLWADRVAMGLPAVSIVVNENRDWILEKFPNAGRVLLGVLDQANRIAEYYGWARMGIDGARYLKSQLDPAVAQWRAERGAADNLTSSQQKAVEGIERELDIIQKDLSKTEIEAANEAVKIVEANPSAIEPGKPPGERTAKVGQHEVVEVKDPATGVIHCEFHSNGGPTIDCPVQWRTTQPQVEPSTPAEPPKGEEPVKPGTEGTGAALDAEKARHLEDVRQARAVTEKPPTPEPQPVEAKPQELKRELSDLESKIQQAEARRNELLESAEQKKARAEDLKSKEFIAKGDARDKLGKERREVEDAAKKDSVDLDRANEEAVDALKKKRAVEQRIKDLDDPQRIRDHMERLKKYKTDNEAQLAKAQNAEEAAAIKRRVTEAKGEIAATEYVAQKYPDYVLEVGWSGPGGGFDQVWRGPNGELLIVEAKGPGAKLATDARKGPQMSREWVEKTAQEMAMDPATSELGNEILDRLTQAKPKGPVRGIVVEATEGGGAKRLSDDDVPDKGIYN